MSDRERGREEDLGGILEIFERYMHRTTENSLPCEVTAVNANRTKVSVKPLIAMVGENGEVLSRNEITGIHVETFGAGGWLISPPIKVGDLGWIEASDRDISLFLQSFKEEQPPTERMHSFSDARFVPDIMKGFSIDSADADALVIQNLDGSVKIALNGNKITGVAPGGFELNGAQITPDGDVITASGISLDGHGHLPGSYNVAGTPVSGEAGEPT